METATLLLPVTLTRAGVIRAQHDLERVEKIVGRNAETGENGHASKAIPDIVKVYEHARTIPVSRTRDLLELFAREDPLTPEEIGIELGTGQPLTKAQGRAFIRNLSRMEGHMLDGGRIARRVLVKDFADYKREGAGRYGLSDADREALRRHLGL